MHTLFSNLATLAFTGHLLPAQLRLHSRSTMIALSHAIEEQAAASGPETVLIATFQRLSLFQRESARYARLAPGLAQVFVIGVPDALTDPISGVNVLPIDQSWPLVEEWVVIASGPTCCAALLSRDAEGFRLNQRSRRFAGRWTTEPAEVDRALQRFYEAIGQPPPVVQREALASLQTAATIRRALSR
jgi:DICT domain-containing protein